MGALAVGCATGPVTIPYFPAEIDFLSIFLTNAGISVLVCLYFYYFYYLCTVCTITIHKRHTQ